MHHYCWWSGIVVSALASINELNLRRARLILRWAIVSGFKSRCRKLIFDVTNQPRKANLAFHTSRVGKLSTSFLGVPGLGRQRQVYGSFR